MDLQMVLMLGQQKDSKSVGSMVVMMVELKVFGMVI